MGQYYMGFWDFVKEKSASSFIPENIHAAL